MNNMEKMNLQDIKDINELNAKHNEWLKSNQAQEREFNECRQRIIRVEREARRRDEELFRGRLADSVAKENGFSLRVAEIIVNKAWEDGHSRGLSEVRTYAQIHSEFVADIINALREDGTIPMFAG